MARKKAVWKTNLKLFSLVLGGILLLAFFGKIAETIKNSHYDGQNRINLILTLAEEKSPTIVFSLEPKAKSLVAVLIPSSTRVVVARDSGIYDIGNVYRLGELSPEKGGGGKLLSQTVQNFLGTGIDGWVIIKCQMSGGKCQMDKNSLSIRNLLTSPDSNLTIIDKVRIWSLAQGIGLDKIEVVDISSQLDLDKMAVTLFPNTQLLKEHQIVEIVNATDITGLGADFARIITNMGGQVLRVVTSQETLEESAIFSREKSYTAEKLGSIFSLPVKINKNKELTSDIEILLGKDYLR